MSTGALGASTCARPRYEKLRCILEKQNGRRYALEEVKEIGDGLIEFVRILYKLSEEVGKN